MKRSGNFFLWIALLAGGLLISITIAQIVTQKSLFRLSEGNKQANATVTMNNRLQEMVNLAFELETKLLTGKQVDLVSVKRGIKDSLTRLEYNVGVLGKLWSDSTEGVPLKQLVRLVDNQSKLSFSILSAIEKNNSTDQKLLLDSLRKSHWSDSIYASAISFQKGIEQNLKATLEQNDKAAAQLSLLNRLLAGVALLAVLVLATIIIRRQVKQLSLIKDLQEARKVALQSVEAKDQFLANMSHEIRTPLNAIKGFGRILSQTQLNKEQQKYTSIISTASENLLNIVNDILDFSKIEAGNLVMKKKTFQLGQVVSEVELMFTPLAQEKELKLVFSIDSSIPGFVKGDPERLRQILVNLLSNAIKFTNAGNVTLKVKYTGEKDGRIKTKFSVSDTGVGIPLEKVHLIFERFEQLDYSFTRQQGGTGLGLAITKKLVEAMGGKINVISEVGKGSVFTVELDFEKISNTVAEQEVLLPVYNVENTSLSNLRILVAEDNKMNQLLVKSILDKYNVITELVDNGEDAMTAMSKRQYDMVLMDVQMPKIDGITATKMLRKNTDSNTPIIAMTAHVLPGEREKCIEAGMNDYLAKPLDEEDFIIMLKKQFSLNQRKNTPSEKIKENDWLNMTYLNNICGDDQRKIELILTELKKQLLLEITTLKNSIGIAEKGELQKICHHLKSTLSPFKLSATPIITLKQVVSILNTDGADKKSIENVVNQLIVELNTASDKVDSILKGID